MKGKESKKKRNFYRWFTELEVCKEMLFVMGTLILVLVISILLTLVYVNFIYVGKIENNYPEQWYISAEQDETCITLYKEKKDAFDVIMDVNGTINYADTDRNTMYTIERINDQLIISCVMTDDGNTALDGVTKKYSYSNFSKLSVERWRTKQKYISYYKEKEFFNTSIVTSVVFDFLYVIVLFIALDVSRKRR